jgi:hypothetical protein
VLFFTVKKVYDWKQKEEFLKLYKKVFRFHSQKNEGGEKNFVHKNAQAAKKSPPKTEREFLYNYVQFKKNIFT